MNKLQTVYLKGLHLHMEQLLFFTATTDSLKASHRVTSGIFKGLRGLRQFWMYSVSTACVREDTYHTNNYLYQDKRYATNTTNTIAKNIRGFFFSVIFTHDAQNTTFFLQSSIAVSLQITDLLQCDCQ